jgi:hypothetical protein
VSRTYMYFPYSGANNGVIFTSPLGTTRNFLISLLFFNLRALPCLLGFPGRLLLLSSLLGCPALSPGVRVYSRWRRRTLVACRWALGRGWGFPGRLVPVVAGGWRSVLRRGRRRGTVVLGGRGWVRGCGIRGRGGWGLVPPLLRPGLLRLRALAGFLLPPLARHHGVAARHVLPLA